MSEFGENQLKQNTSATGTRLERWDIVRLALVFLVVLGHLADPLIDGGKTKALFLFIYTFHMPCFLFVSGLFAKKNVDEKRYDKIFSYLVMHIVIKILIAVVRAIIYGKVSFKLFSESGLPWYVFAVFAFSMITVFLKRFSPKWVLIAWIVLACIAGYDSSIGDQLMLSRIIVFYPFFFVGYCTSAEKLDNVLSKRSVKIISAIILVVFIAFLVIFANKVYFLRPLLTGRNAFSSLGSYGKDYLVRWGGLIRLFYYPAVMIICMAFIAVIPGRAGKIIPEFGKRTLQIFVLHRLLIYFMYEMLPVKTFLTDNRGYIWLIFPAALVITWVFGLKIWERPFKLILYPHPRKNNSIMK